MGADNEPDPAIGAAAELAEALAANKAAEAAAKARETLGGQQPRSEQKNEHPKGAESPKGWEIKPGPQWDAVLYPPVFDPDELTKVGGLVGDLAAWITKVAPRRQPILSIGAALAAVGTLIGSRVAGPTDIATSLLVILLAASAAGKGSPMACAKSALMAAGAPHLMAGPWRSSVALENQLKKQPVLLSTIDEYGMFLRRVLKSNAGGFESEVITVVQELWNLNFDWYLTSSAARDQMEKIWAPVLTILGTSTYGDFFGTMSSKQIDGGLVNRHLVVVGDDHAPRQTPQSKKVPAALMLRLRALYRRRPGQLTFDEILERKTDDPKPEPKAFDPEIKLGWGPGAEAIFNEMADMPIGLPEGMQRNLLGRVAETAERVATAVAFGRGSHTIHELDMLWARAFVLHCSECMSQGLTKYNDDPHSFAQLCRVIPEALAEAGGWMSLSALKRKFTNLLRAGGDLDRALNYLVDAEIIRRAERKPVTGRPSPGYELVSPVEDA